MKRLIFVVILALGWCLTASSGEIWKNPETGLWEVKKPHKVPIEVIVPMETEEVKDVITPLEVPDKVNDIMTVLKKNEVVLPAKPRAVSKRANIPSNRIVFGHRAYVRPEQIFYDSTLKKLNEGLEKQPEELAKVLEELKTAKGRKREELERRRIVLAKLPVFGNYTKERIAKLGKVNPKRQNGIELDRPEIYREGRRSIYFYVDGEQKAYLKNIGRCVIILSYLKQDVTQPIPEWLCPTYRTRGDWEIEHHFTSDQLGGEVQVMEVGGKVEYMIIPLANGDTITYSHVWNSRAGGNDGGDCGSSPGGGEGGGGAGGAGSDSGGDSSNGGCGGTGTGSSDASRGSAGEGGDSGGSAGR